MTHLLPPFGKDISPWSYVKYPESLPAFAVEAGHIVDSWNKELAKLQNTMESYKKLAHQMNIETRRLRNLYMDKISTDFFFKPAGDVYWDLRREMGELEYHAYFAINNYTSHSITHPDDTSTFEWLRIKLAHAKSNLAACTTPEQVVVVLGNARKIFEQATKHIVDATSEKERSQKALTVYRQRVQTIGREQQARMKEHVLVNPVHFPALGVK